MLARVPAAALFDATRAGAVALGLMPRWVGGARLHPPE